jgi:hypothetical protein
MKKMPAEKGFGGQAFPKEKTPQALKMDLGGSAGSRLPFKTKALRCRAFWRWGDVKKS